MKRLKIITFIMIMLFASVCSGCSKRSFFYLDEMIAETEQHQYFSSGGKFYIHYETDYTKDPKLYYVDSPCYNSYDEIIAILTKNEASDETREFLQRRFGDENGDIPVFDTDNMYQVSHPDFEFFKICFFNDAANSYEIILKNHQYRFTKALRVAVFGDTESYEQSFEKDTGYSNHSKTVVSDLPERNANVYFYDSNIKDSTGGGELGIIGEHIEYKEIHYTLTSNDGRVMYVIEQYISTGSTFDTVPDNVIIHVADNGIRYRISTEWQYDTLPTEEWLLSFGMEQYIPENAK